MKYGPTAQIGRIHVVILMALILAACSGNATPTPAPIATSVPAAVRAASGNTMLADSLAGIEA